MALTFAGISAGSISSVAAVAHRQCLWIHRGGLAHARGPALPQELCRPNIAWNAETRAFYDAEAIKGLEFRNPRSLFGAALITGEPVIANESATDPRSGGLPPGHPLLNAFLGVPIRHGGKMLAMLGLANRLGGCDWPMIKFLHPLLATLGQLADAQRVDRHHRQVQIELARLLRVASETTNGVIIADPQGQGFMAIESDVSERKRLEGIKGEFVSTVSHELRTP